MSPVMLVAGLIAAAAVLLSCWGLGGARRDDPERGYSNTRKQRMPRPTGLGIRDLRLDGEDLLIMKESDVMGVIEQSATMKRAA